MADEPERGVGSGGAAEEAPAWEARKLLRSARSGVLATSIEGQPFASLVTPACAADLSVLMLLSNLSEHTRHLRADSRCAVMVTGSPQDANPQTAPRVTVTGLAEVANESKLKANWLSRHPYAAFYADFGDFNLWRIQLRGGLFVGGFARATRLRPADLTPDPGAVAALDAAEADIITHCNADHADALAIIASAQGGAPGDWRMVAADVDGCDLTQGDNVVRIAWESSVPDGGGVRKELIRLARAARAAASAPPPRSG